MTFSDAKDQIAQVLGYKDWTEFVEKTPLEELNMKKTPSKLYLRIEDIAIGFSKWCEENGWSWSIDHQLYLHYDGKSLGKTDHELFKDYMESLKP